MKGLGCLGYLRGSGILPNDDAEVRQSLISAYGVGSWRGRVSKEEERKGLMAVRGTSVRNSSYERTRSLEKATGPKYREEMWLRGRVGEGDLPKRYTELVDKPTWRNLPTGG